LRLIRDLALGLTPGKACDHASTGSAESLASAASDTTSTSANIATNGHSPSWAKYPAALTEV